MGAFPRLTVQQMIGRCTKLPVCPDLFAQLSVALKDPAQNICQLSQIISHDPVLTAKVLRVANSALYGLAQSVRSVDDAVLRLGFEEIFSIAAAARARDLFTSVEGWAGLGESLWSHSVLTAITAQTLAKKLTQRRTDDAYYTAALLHDFGKLLFAQLDPEYRQLTEQGQIYGAALIEREVQRYGFTHAELGAELLKQWRLPKLILSAVEKHHDTLTAGTAPDFAILVVMAADFLSHEGHRSKEGSPITVVPDLPPPLAAHVRISRDELVIVAADSAYKASVL